MLSEVTPAAEPSINDNNDNNNGGKLVNEDSMKCYSKIAACPLTQLIGTWEIKVDENIFTTNIDHITFVQVALIHKERKLLTKLYPILSILNTSTNTSQTAQTELEANLPSLFLIKTALRLGKIDLAKHTMNRSNYFTSETSKTIGEMQSFPSSLINFFDGMIITLEKKKHEVINRKRKQRNLELKSLPSIAKKNEIELYMKGDENIIISGKYKELSFDGDVLKKLIPVGNFEYTITLPSNYEDIFNNLLQIYFNNWDINDIYNKIAEIILIGCQVPSPNVVILEPEKSPNCNENVHDVCNMYFNDVGLSNSNYLDIAYDEAIFRRLITYFEKKDNITANLGIHYLDKLEKVVDYQATCHVLELIWIAIGIAISEKSNYTRSVIYFLSYVNDDITLQNLLQYVCSANLTQKGHYFGFDEALERFGDSISIKEECVVKSQKDSLWKLANDLLVAFNLSNPALHELFINTKEMNEEEFQHLFSYYNSRIN
ncbi:hypothetical protein C1645_832009 [Glomus cerebriforme]|uniref:Uncharacterized protein n=1 Tax=Glomus cerebriforme TaxID=658196 RepID=A0A397SIZ6_9GLOM|nr:hypothetical protein C1645_832009 [Glomus cerebriforme]